MYGYDYIKSDDLSGMNRFLVDAREKRMARYLEDPEDLQSRANGEVQTRDDYSGREILELLQNAVDASHAGDKILVELNGDMLRVCNNGDAFTEGGINSILIPNLSPKNEYENLGNKGLGFRSLLNDSEYVTVWSESLSIRMGMADAMAYKKLRNLAVRPPVLSVPRVIEIADEQDFVTVVECKLKDEKSIAKIKYQIEEIDRRSIIFLPKIAEIELRIDGAVHIIRKTHHGQTCQVEEIENNRTMTTEYYIVQKIIKDVETGDEDDDGQEIRKDINITMACDLECSLNLNSRFNFLYNAFPTKVTMPTGWIVNVNFALNADRNAINEKIYNWQALKGVVDLMFEEAEKIARRKCDFEAIKTLIGDYSMFDFSFAGEKIADYFMKKLRAAKLLPGVNGNYLALDDKPYFYEYDFTQYLSGEGFESTIMYCDDEDIDKFLIEHNGVESPAFGLGYRHMADWQLSALIDERLDKMSIAAQIDLSKIFKDEYGYRAETKPNFFVDQNGKRINHQSEKFTESDSSVAKNVPSFLNIKFVKKEYIAEIHRQTGTTAKDFESSEYAKYYNIKQYRLLNIAETYKRAAENDAKRVQDYLYWLYQNEVSTDTIFSNGLGEVPIPAKFGGVVDINESIFPGGFYEELFPDSQYIIEWFGDESEGWRQFLQSLGGCEFSKSFGRDFTEDTFKDILREHAFEQVRRLLNGQTWLSLNSDAKFALNYTPWVEYHGKKYSPHRIILDDEYGEKFENCLGIEGSALRRHLELKPEIFDVLNFRDDITDMLAEDIYEILLQLPEVDKRGKLAKKIYRTIVKDATLEGRMLEDKKRQDFVEHGKVFCKDRQYHPVNETYYFAKGLLPRAVLKDKNLIEIDKKRGAKRVKNLFGVARLEVDFYADRFESHLFQQQFLDVLKTMKIGVLATGKLELADESKRDIKNMKIQLCRYVSVVVNGETRILEDYEFATKQNSPSEYCLKIPDEWKKFEDIRYDLQFTDAITEMFVMRIGTGHAEENSDSIARVVETRDVRQFIIKQENGAERYAEAAKFMGEVVETEKPSEDDVYEKNVIRLKNALLKYEKMYLKTLHEDLKDASMEEQAKFESLRNGFINFWPDNEDILFDAEFDPEKYVCEQFAIRKDVQSDLGEESWRQASVEFGEALNDYNDVKSLARFGHLDVVRAKMAERKKREEELEKRLPEAKAVPVAKIVKREAPLVGKTHGNLVSMVRRGGFGGGGHSVIWRDIGYTGQEVVKKTLRDQGYEPEDWSGEAIRNHENSVASDSYGYDLLYVDGDGVTHYIEVKSHIDKVKHVTFEMSSNEFGQAKRLSEQPDAKYEIYLVDCLDQNKYEKPEIQILDFLKDVERNMVPEPVKKYYYAG